MLSQTAEYALRAMAILAHTPDELIPTPRLAAETQVPSNYLAKVLQLLAGADLIVGRRGVGGGYRLARPSTEISMLQVVSAVETVGRITGCPLGLASHNGNLCPLHHRLNEAMGAVHTIFAETSLGDLISGPGAGRPLCDAVPTADAARVSVNADVANAQKRSTPPRP